MQLSSLLRFRTTMLARRKTFRTPTPTFSLIHSRGWLLIHENLAPILARVARHWMRDDYTNESKRKYEILAKTSNVEGTFQNL